MTEAQLAADTASVSQRLPRRQRWVPFDLDGWPEVAAALPLPWPQSAAAFDLRWHTAQEGGGEVPYGKRFWMKRWGWTDWGVRALLRREGWRDPIHPLSTQDPPKIHPRTTQDPPAAGRTKRTNRPPSTQDPPADHPLTTQDPPADHHTRVGLQGQGQKQGQESEAKHTPPEQATQEEHKEQPDNSLPGWTRVKGYGRHEVLAAVVHAIEQITQRTCNPHRCQTDAKHVLALQKATNTPWPELSRQVEQVAEWARDSNDPLAARDIRAEGWDNGTDRSRSVSTLCVQSRWADRLRAAEEWHTPPVPVPRPVYDERPPPKLPSLRAAWEERRRQQQADAK